MTQTAALPTPVTSPATATLRIVVLDARPTDTGDLDWEPLRALGEVTLYDRTTPDEIAERVQDAQVVLTNKVKLAREAFEAAPQLQYVGELATGYDNIDLEAAREKGITVCNVAGYSSEFTAQMTWALLLELCARVGEHSRLVHAGAWAESPDFSFWHYPLVQLAGRTLLVVGMGNIGKRVARIGQAFGMNVLAAQLPGREAANGEFPRVPLDEALPQADVVSLHCPLRPETRGLINAERLKMLRPSALLVNTGRGPLVVDEAVSEALRTEQLAGYAADVLSQEPPPIQHPLYNAPNCIITPHLSWASHEARSTLLSESVENLRAFVAGKPRNVVS